MFNSLGMAIKRLTELVQQSVDSGITQRELAQHIGVSQSTINNILAGTQPKRLDVLSNFAQYYQVDLSDIWPQAPTKKTDHNQPTASQIKKVPILTYIQAGQFRDRAVPPYPGQAEDFIETDMPGEKIFALRVKGASMEPEFREGEVIIVNPNLEPVPGDYVIVKSQDHGSEDATLKQLKKLGSTFFLHPLNPAFEDIPLTKSHKIVGKVVRRQKDY